MRRIRMAALLAAGLLVPACGQDDKPAPAGGSPGAPSVSAAVPGDPAKGKQIWLAQCVACHNVDPAKDGAVGPAVKGASRELLEARVLHAAYPPGYKPKRETKAMPARPDLVEAIPDLSAYLR